MIRNPAEKIQVHCFRFKPFYALAYLMAAPVTRASPIVRIPFMFMHFSGKDWRPREILDPPLLCIGHFLIFNFQSFKKFNALIKQLIIVSNISGEGVWSN